MTHNPTTPSGAVKPPLPAGRHRIMDWDVPDPNGRPIEEVRDIREDLQARGTALLRDLNI